MYGEYGGGGWIYACTHLESPGLSSLPLEFFHLSPLLCLVSLLQTTVCQGLRGRGVRRDVGREDEGMLGGRGIMGVENDTAT